MKEDTRVTVQIPAEFPNSLIEALRTHPLTGKNTGDPIERDKWHERLGWFVCAYEVLVEMAQERRL